MFAKRDTKLRLISGPAEENHQHAGNFKRNLLSMVLFDQGEATKVVLTPAPATGPARPPAAPDPTAGGPA